MKQAFLFDSIFFSVFHKTNGKALFPFDILQTANKKQRAFYMVGLPSSLFLPFDFGYRKSSFSSSVLLKEMSNQYSKDTNILNDTAYGRERNQIPFIVSTDLKGVDGCNAS